MKEVGVFQGSTYLFFWGIAAIYSLVFLRYTKKNYRNFPMTKRFPATQNAVRKG